MENPTAPSSPYPEGRAADISLLRLIFACEVTGDEYLAPIWYKVTQSKGCVEGLSTLNQALM